MSDLAIVVRTNQLHSRPIRLELAILRIRAIWQQHCTGANNRPLALAMQPRETVGYHILWPWHMLDSVLEGLHLQSPSHDLWNYRLMQLQNVLVVGKNRELGS